MPSYFRSYARGPSNDGQLYHIVQTILRCVGASLNEKYVALRRKAVHHFEDLKHTYLPNGVFVQFHA